MDVNERELIKRAKGGDRKAFDKLIMEYKDKMFGLTYRMTGDREAALDLTQDTFLAAFKDLRRFREQSAFSSWLYRIAANKSINFIRRRKLLSFVSLGEMPNLEPSYEMNSDPDSATLAKAVGEGLKDLPPKQKLVFNLRFFEKMPFGKIAEVLDKSESTVKTNYRKAVEKLRAKLKDFR